MVDSLSTGLLLGASAMMGAGVLANRVLRLRQIVGRQAALRDRLDGIESAMYAHESVEELPTEPVRAPAFALKTVDGVGVTLDRLLALGKPVMLVFTDPAGATGLDLLATIAAWQMMNDAPLTAVVIAPGSTREMAPIVTPPGIAAIVGQEHGEVSRAYGIALTPAVVVMRPNGALAGTPTVGARGIDALLGVLARAASEAQARREATTVQNTPGIGDRAPMMMLQDLEGVDRQVLQPGQARVLLFWSPLCGYCTQLVPDLHAREAAPTDGRPPITLVARGSVEQNREEGFAFQTLLDDDLSASSAFGVLSTPSAMVVDGQGIVMSRMARGIREVRELLGMNAPASAPSR